MISLRRPFLQLYYNFCTTYSQNWYETTHKYDIQINIVKSDTSNGNDLLV